MDVERLCNVHIPRWLENAGHGLAKIATYYDDPVKQAYDAFCTKKAYFCARSRSTTGLYWVAQRWASSWRHWLRRRRCASPS